MELDEIKEKFDYFLSHNDKKWHLSELHIIAPYPTLGFFEELLEIELFNPRDKLFLYVDDGWPGQVVQSIGEHLSKELGDDKYVLSRISANPTGFVHAKIYFFKWKSDKNTTFRHLLIGSANASTYGFGGHAETYALIWHGDTKAIEESETDSIEKDYFKRLINSEKTDCIKTRVGEHSWVSLPAIKVVSKGSAAGKCVGSFDAWLKRGRLCHKFDPSPNFGKFLITMDRKIPSSELKKIFASSSFVDATSTSQLRYAYLKKSEGKKHPVEQWKSKYFIETNYGHWTSEECHKQKEEEFKSKSYSDLSGHIDELTRICNDNLLKAKLINRFTDAIQGLAEGLSQDAKKYIKHKSSKVDIDYYEKLAREQLSGDEKLAKDKTFKERYIKGFSFPACPSMSDEDLDEFATSFCDDLLLEMQKSRSLLAKTLLKIRDQEMSSWKEGKDLLLWLRNEVNWSKHQEAITGFWDEKNLSRNSRQKR